MSTDKSPNSDKSKRQSYVEEEELEVKPSPELISDEYDHFQEAVSTIAVHTFCEKRFEGNVSQFCDTLKRCGMDVKDENRHSLREDNCDEVLDSISLNTDNMNGLIILFCGTSNIDGELKMFDGEKMDDVKMEKIWSKFFSHKCVGFKNKPKIFIFVVSPPTSTQTDGLRMAYELTYDTPNEADILTIYHKTDDYDGGDFIENFCHNIEQYGKHEDIISLVTLVVSQHIRPLIISTLTRKFYFDHSDVRGYHLTMRNDRIEAENHMKEVKDMLENYNTPLKDKLSKEKKKFSFRSFSFRKKKEKQEEQIEESVICTVTSQSEIQCGTRTANQTTSTTKRTTNRSRLASQTESDGAMSSSKRLSEKDNKNRPAWKP